VLIQSKINSTCSESLTSSASRRRFDPLRNEAGVAVKNVFTSLLLISVVALALLLAVF
jgi:hypothetical protein